MYMLHVRTECQFRVAYGKSIVIIVNITSQHITTSASQLIITVPPSLVLDTA